MATMKNILIEVEDYVAMGMGREEVVIAMPETPRVLVESAYDSVITAQHNEMAGISL